MSAWEEMAVQILATAVAVGLVLLGFWGLVVRPYFDRKMAELIELSQQIEPRVTRGIKRGLEETLRELPGSALDGTARESTRQFLKFGSGLFENGLSSFLGSAADLERRSAADKSGQGGAD